MFDGIFSKQFWLATILAVVIIFAWDFFFLKDIRNAQQSKINNSSKSTTASNSATFSNNSVANGGTVTNNTTPVSRKEVVIKTTTLNGAINLVGGIIDHIELLQYKVDLTENSKNIIIFDYNNTPKAYYFLSGWVGDSDLPNINSVWSANKSTLGANDSVILSWTNKNGITFRKTIALDNNYLFTIKDEVISNSSKGISLSPYSLILRYNKPNVEDLFISHEGFVGYVNKTLERVNYGDVKDQSSYNFKTNSGFIGFTDKYWLSGLLVNNNNNHTARFINFKDANNIDNYQVDFQGEFNEVVSGKSLSSSINLFVGPKEYNLLKLYNKQLNISNFEDAIDFGWFFFFTKPMISFLLFINSSLGSFGLAILLFTIIIRLCIFPIGYKSYVSLAKMKELQPKMKLLKEQHAANLPQYNKELMLLYKKEKVNPLSGCIPVLLQIPIFFSIYKVIFISIELRHAPFYGWVHDMSAKDPTNLFNLFGLLPFNTPAFLSLGVWPILMGITMFFQQKLSSTQPTDPIQKKVMDFMPLMLTFILATFPVGLVIYWTWSNIISIVQQFIITKLVSKKVK